jgi:hypothetical protein
MQNEAILQDDALKKEVTLPPPSFTRPRMDKPSLNLGDQDDLEFTTTPPAG